MTNDKNSMTIWMLVEQCARELTKNGNSPFTRSDLIRCIQKQNASFGPDSINPIIQGLTDNLKGGAKSAGGKNILHSVGRGLFTLSDKNLAPFNFPHRNTSVPKQTNAILRTPPLKLEVLTNQNSNVKIIKIKGYDFRYVCTINPERESDGTVLTFNPKTRFVNIDNLPVNKYGNGPFCKFKIPQNLELPGIYALVETNIVKYIGECEKLSSRYNMGYGIISPRNCFVGGQETNCWINNIILKQISDGSIITLWFHNSSNHKSIEAELRAQLSPSWNRI